MWHMLAEVGKGFEVVGGKGLASCCGHAVCMTVRFTTWCTRAVHIALTIRRARHHGLRHRWAAPRLPGRKFCFLSVVSRKCDWGRASFTMDSFGAITSACQVLSFALQRNFISTSSNMWLVSCSLLFLRWRGATSTSSSLSGPPCCMPTWACAWVGRGWLL